MKNSKEMTIEEMKIRERILYQQMDPIRKEIKALEKQLERLIHQREFIQERRLQKEKNQRKPTRVSPYASGKVRRIRSKYTDEEIDRIFENALKKGAKHGTAN